MGPRLSFIAIKLVRLLLSPIILIFILLLKQGRARLGLELNQQSSSDESFDWAFHISSEGELEQAMPYINSLVARGKRIQLFYTSLSVKKKCDDLGANNNSIKVYLFPIFFFLGKRSFGSLVKAKSICLCRYDFLPDLVSYSYKNYSVLIQATLKNKNTKAFSFIWNHFAYKSFNKIITSLRSDIDKFEDIGIQKKNLFYFESRHIQILNRLKHAREKIEEFTQGKEFLDCLEKSNSYIIGNAWPREIGIQLKNLEPPALIFIAPHRLTGEFIDELQEEVLKTRGNKLKLIDFRLDNNDFSDGGIITTPGILCELYAFFPKIIVGGGFFGDTHSLLEPSWSGANVICGAGTSRSTEYDSAKELFGGRVNSIKAANLAEAISNMKEERLPKEDIERKIVQINEDFEQVKKAVFNI